MYVEVLVENRVSSNDMTFTYHVPSNIKEDLVGRRVLVPFNNRNIEGFVLGYTTYSDEYEIKDIIKIKDEEKILNEELLNLGKFMSNKYLCPLIYSYQAMLPSALKANHNMSLKTKKVSYVKLNTSAKLDNIKGKSMLDIIRLLKENDCIKKSLIKSKSSLKRLIDYNIVIEVKKEEYRNVETKEVSNNITLTKDQERVSNIVKENLNKGDTYLLYGVTSSGKTEVYIDIVKEVIKNKKGAIILVPEISLTPQITARFKGVFKDNIAILHSSLSDGEKYDEYRKILRGEVSVVIGARSAIFAPVKNIGVIIIDEEHSESYKQENNPRYNTYDIAKERSNTHNCPIILASATPKIESYARSMKGYYKYLELLNRVNKKPMPKVTIVDMKDEIKKGNMYFSSVLLDKMHLALSKKEQVMLLINRRGYSNYLTCKSCGFVYKCPNCDITLTYHKTSDMLRCHYCGYATKKEDKCPNCKEESLRQMGLGTEKIEEMLKEKFPDSNIVRMDRDTTTKKGSHYKIINDFNDGKYDILVGTQMISKGLNFPNVTLVGVINADMSLNLPNFRSSEVTFSLLDQTTGRCGRAEKEGEAIVQTFNPDHYSIVCAANHDYKTFFKQELMIRKKLNYPPYCFITLIKIIAKDFNYGIKEAKKISEYLRKNLNSTNVLGPGMASILKINNLYNFEVILKYKKDDKLYSMLKNIIKIYEGNNNIKIEMDFDPNNL